MTELEKQRLIRLVNCIVCKHFAWSIQAMVPTKDKQGRWHHPSCNAVTQKR